MLDFLKMFIHLFICVCIFGNVYATACNMWRSKDNLRQFSLLTCQSLGSSSAQPSCLPLPLKFKSKILGTTEMTLLIVDKVPTV